MFIFHVHSTTRCCTHNYYKHYTVSGSITLLAKQSHSLDKSLPLNMAVKVIIIIISDLHFAFCALQLSVRITTMTVGHRCQKFNPKVRSVFFTTEIDGSGTFQHCYNICVCWHQQRCTTELPRHWICLFVCVSLIFKTISKRITRPSNGKFWYKFLLTKMKL